MIKPQMIPKVPAALHGDIGVPHDHVNAPLKDGARLLLDVLADEGIEYIFGNPGTTEMPLMHALASYPDLTYILGLQETAVVAMADGYAQATGKPAFVNLHTAGGLGHAMGALVHARVAQTPMLVTAGQQDTRHLHADPLLSGNLVDIARPATKWARELSHPDEIPVMVRRALQDTVTAPAGPVFLSLPIDMMTAPARAKAGGRSRIDRQAVAGGLDELAEALASGAPGRLAVVSGDEVTRSDAISEATALADALGAPVYGPSWPGYMSFPTDHPLWAGNLPSTAGGMHSTLEDYDAVLVLGGHSLISYLYSEGPAVPISCDLYQVSEDVGELGRRYPARLACHGHLKTSLRALLPLVSARMAAHEEGVARLRSAASSGREARLAALERRIAAEVGASVISPLVSAAEVLRAAGGEVPVVDEAPATMHHVRSALEKWPVPKYVFMRSAILGWGLPAAIGVSLGLDRAPVLALLGDGSALYSPQALWSAARYRVPVTFVIMNNAEYNILKKYSVAQGYGADGNSTVPGLEIDDPRVDFMALAASMGIRSRRVGRAHEIGPAVREGIASNEPNLVEIVIAPE